jgi:lipopolysaccharide/colanic/teichoic acid biosynthesis glycosyltransferase
LDSQGAGNSRRFDILLSGSAPTEVRRALKEDAFRRMISVERKRTERSQEPFLLMLLESGTQENSGKRAGVLEGTISALLPTIRETDIIGWYKDDAIVGVMFTGLTSSDKNSVLSIILNKVSTALRCDLTLEEFSRISISFHFFPDDWNPGRGERSCNPALYPDLENPESGKQSLFLLKRTMDIFGSAFLLVLFSPLFAVIALAIKLSSKGPVFFKQERIGQYGRRFTFLKFRSMLAENDQSEHKEYVEKLIAGSTERIPLSRDASGVFKLAHDRRITPIGKLLRRSSLDELPQFLNVLKGDMSLVGPRPPIAYEVAAYQIWHRRRLLQVKPGITGLWQVTGRSRVPFDEMVRLDLQYATCWTLWLDFKILIWTPNAVIKGAY